MNQTNLSINLAYSISILFGCILEWQYAFVENFQYFNLLNLSGIVFDFLGVLLVSYAVFVKLTIQEILATHISRYIVIFTLPFSASMFTTSLLAFVLGTQSIIFFSPILEPLYGEKLDAKLRLKLLGAIFIILGFSFQIVAIIIDINISM